MENNQSVDNVREEERSLLSHPWNGQLTAQGIKEFSDFALKEGIDWYSDFFREILILINDETWDAVPDFYHVMELMERSTDVIKALNEELSGRYFLLKDKEQK